MTAPGGSEIQFLNNATAGFNTYFTNKGATVEGTFGGLTGFGGSSTADFGAFTNEGAGVGSAVGGLTIFGGSSTAANGTFTNNGATVSGAFGGQTIFRDDSTAGSATLIANGGTNGGEGGKILFLDGSEGGTSRVEVFGNGSLDLSDHPFTFFTIGSIEGSGNVFSASVELHVGGNNMNTEFSGSMDPIALIKEGTGRLTLSGTGVNVAGTTFVSEGVLQVDGSIMTGGALALGARALRGPRSQGRERSMAMSAMAARSAQEALAHPAS